MESCYSWLSGCGGDRSLKHYPISIKAFEVLCRHPAVHEWVNATTEDHHRELEIELHARRDPGAHRWPSRSGPPSPPPTNPAYQTRAFFVVRFSPQPWKPGPSLLPMPAASSANALDSPPCCLRNIQNLCTSNSKLQLWRRRKWSPSLQSHHILHCNAGFSRSVARTARKLIVERCALHVSIEAWGCRPSHAT